MAHMLTKAEFAERLADYQRRLDKLGDGDFICPLCGATMTKVYYEEKTGQGVDPHRARRCYCDYD